MNNSVLPLRGYNTPPVSLPYLPASVNLVTKNFQIAAAATQFSEVRTPCGLTNLIHNKATFR